MLSTPLKALLGVLFAIIVVGGVGYVSGAFDRFAAQPPMQLAAVPPASAPQAQPTQPQAQPASANPAAGTTTEPAASASQPASAPTQPAAPAEAKPADAAPSQPATLSPAQPAPVQAGIVPPTFDILRAEADGSIVIAGKAPAGSKVEILAGSKVIGAAVAGPAGDFAVVIDEPLAPGSYQIVLRATDETSTVAMSTETAVVSIPESEDGQVLALVEQPGQPSKLITVPEPMVSTPAAPVEQVPPPAETTAAAEPQKPASAPAAPATDLPAATAPAATEPQETRPADVAVAKPDAAPAPAAGLMVEVKAIEIEGNKVFVAGIATPKKPVRAYANAIMLGDTKSSETGEFLIEALVDLPVGDYIVRADLLADDGNKVLMRAQVPFRREAGEAIAAVAPPVQPAPDASAPASGAASTQPQAAAGTSSATAPAPSTSTATATAPAPATTADTVPAVTAPSAAAAPSGTAAPTTAPATAPTGQVAAADPAAVEAAVPKPDLAMPTEPPSITAAPLQAADGAVIIRRGDSLWRISRRVYGRGVRYSTIYLANQQQIADPDRIWPGQVFTVPVKTGTGEAANMDAMGGQAVSPEDLAKYPPVR